MATATQQEIEQAHQIIDEFNKYKDVNYPIFYMISVGAERKMHTLWSINLLALKNPYVYIKNVDDNILDAVKKLVKEYACIKGRIEIDQDETLERLKGDWFKILKFGKYIGENVDSLLDKDVKYCYWLYKQAHQKNIENKFRLSKLDNYVLSDEYYKAMKDRFSKTEVNKGEFVGCVGDKFNMVLTYKSRTYYDNAYNTVWINIFEDEEGNEIVYKGKCVDTQIVKDHISGKIVSNKQMDKLYHLHVQDGRVKTNHEGYDRMNKAKELIKRINELKPEFEASHVDENLNFYDIEYIDLDYKGVKFNVTGIIKEHLEYKGKKQTIIQRPKFEIILK